jgi:hypothetical protein
MLPVSPVPPSPLLMTGPEAWSIVLLGPFTLGLAMVLLLVTLKIGDDDDTD